MTPSSTPGQITKRPAAGRPVAWPGRLLDWYADNRRDLPWRKSRDPYAVWVSEVMLQQTQVDTVIPYYQRFLKRFPTITHLANARMNSVLRLWQGLGYYSRARNFHRAARTIKQQGGHIPSTFAGLRQLPGLGDYTAAAIASIAFNEPVPAIDGNVLRIMARFLALGETPQSSLLRNRAAAELTPVLHRVNPAEFNQAMMELGALICRPSRPACDQCPLARTCQGHRMGNPTAFPVRRASRPLPRYRVVVAIIRRQDGRFLLARRPADRMFGGLWELPGGKVKPGERLDVAIQREINEELGVAIEIIDRQPRVQQTYSHFHVSITPFTARIRDGVPHALEATALRWVTATSALRYPMPLATRRILTGVVPKVVAVLRPASATG